MLRGKPGQKNSEVDARGNERKTVAVGEQTLGDDLYLSLDLRRQRLAESLLGVEAGAVVALDPRNGDVVVMSSGPAYDPNVLSRGLTPALWEQIASDTRHPLTNRALQGQYPPGSTFKIMVASAALESDKWSADTKVRCAGASPSGKHMCKDWKKGGHGVMDLYHAIVQSCDVYFYNIGQRLGIDTIAETARRFGLGQPTGIDLPSERVGVVPSTEWKQRVRKEPWYVGETISASIGQGYITVTPPQMAVAVLVENTGHGGAYAAPIAKALIEEYMKDSDVDDRHQIAGQF